MKSFHQAVALMVLGRSMVLVHPTKLTQPGEEQRLELVTLIQGNRGGAAKTTIHVETKADATVSAVISARGIASTHLVA